MFSDQFCIFYLRLILSGKFLGSQLLPTMLKPLYPIALLALLLLFGCKSDPHTRTAASAWL